MSCHALGASVTQKLPPDAGVSEDASVVAMTVSLSDDDNKN
jgi:hypothetical protein